MNACEDFFEVVVNGHIISCAMHMLGMSDVGDLPTQSIISHEAWMMDDTERRRILMDTATQIVEENVDLSTNFSSDSCSKTATNHVYAYACETLSLGLLYFEFRDAIKEGDGDRVMRIWKYLLLLFKASGRTNYSIEALTLLSQYYLVLPPRLAEQLKWSRFVNVHGLPGHNVSCDLHMEHLNREAKTAIEGLGANKSKKAILCTGKAIGILKDTLDKFDKDNNVPSDRGAHAVKSAKKDLTKIIKQLASSKVFKIIPGRKHKSFRTLKTNLIRTLNRKELTEWILDHYYPIQVHSLTANIYMFTG